MKDHDRPLDALMPELVADIEHVDVPQGPAVFPSVLEVELERAFEWLYAVWRDPGGAVRLRHEVEKMLTVTQLMRLSAPAKDRDNRDFETARLMLFDDISGNVTETLGTLGFHNVGYLAEEYRGRMLALAQAADSMGWSIPKHPKTVWVSPVTHPDPELNSRIRDIDDAIAESMTDSAWGDEPGHMSKLLAEQLKHHFGVDTKPDLEGAKLMDVLLIDHRADALRWMPPMVFQALCDFIGVLMISEFGLEVGWAQATDDANEEAAPPLFRVIGQSGPKLFPVGLKVARWAVMPQLEGLADVLLPDRVREEAFVFQ